MNVHAGVVLVLFGLVAGLLVGAVGGVAAQAAAWRIVQGSDSTLYLLKDGVRYPIVGEDIDDDELAAYGEGEAIGRELLLNASAPMAEAPAGQVMDQPPATDSGVAETPAQEDPAVSPAADAPPAPAASTPPALPLRRAAPTTPTPVPPPSADPRFVAVQGNTAGQTVTVIVQASPGAAACSLDYQTPAGARSTAPGLGTQPVGASGTATWSFTLEPMPSAGTGTLKVTCGGASVSRPLFIGGLSR
jgi:hypothetical protein